MDIKFIKEVLSIKALYKLKAVVLILLLMVLTACTTGSTTTSNSRSTVNNVPPVVQRPAPVQRPIPQPIPRQEPAVVDGRVLQLPEERNIASYSLPEAEPVSSVVRDLMRKARTQSDAGDFDSAANSLERALRIEPRNAQIWSRLAGVRYSQESWKKAIQLAAKSNTLAGQNRTLRRENWYLMSNAHRALGNVEAEQKYRDKLSRQIR